MKMKSIYQDRILKKCQVICLLLVFSKKGGWQTLFEQSKGSLHGLNWKPWLLSHVQKGLKVLLQSLWKCNFEYECMKILTLSFSQWWYRIKVIKLFWKVFILLKCNGKMKQKLVKLNWSNLIDGIGYWRSTSFSLEILKLMTFSMVAMIWSMIFWKKGNNPYGF